MRSGETPKRKKVVPDKKIRISCRRSVLARPSTRISDGTSRTNRPITPEDKCNFSMSLYQCHETKRWYFRKFGDGCKHHSGHYKLQPNQVKARSAVVEKEEMKRVINQLNKNIPTVEIRTLLQQQTGITLSPAQIRKLRQKNKRYFCCCVRVRVHVRIRICTRSSGNGKGSVRVRVRGVVFVFVFIYVFVLVVFFFCSLLLLLLFPLLLFVLPYVLW